MDVLPTIHDRHSSISESVHASFADATGQTQKTFGWVVLTDLTDKNFIVDSTRPVRSLVQARGWQDGPSKPRQDAKLAYSKTRFTGGSRTESIVQLRKQIYAHQRPQLPQAEEKGFQNDTLKPSFSIACSPWSIRYGFGRGGGDPQVNFHQTAYSMD